MTGTTINNISSVKTNYGVYCNTGSTCNLNSGTIINAGNASGIYSYSTTNLKDVEINTSGENSYGVYVNGGTLTLSDETEINSNGVLSYGIYADQYQTTINVNSADIYSKNIGIYLGNARSDAKTLNVNSGSVVGETYGIYQTVANGTTTIGSLENENSIEGPYIEGGLISINKSAGLLYFYSGKLKGYLKGNPGTIDYVRDGYEIFEDSDEIQLYLKNNRTISTSEAQETATENTAKIGNGYSKITYIEKESDNLNSPTIVDEVKASASNLSLTADAINIYDFDFLGDVQEFKIPSNGVYKLEVWGAEGGIGRFDYLSANPGTGGYSYGFINLSQNDILYVYVGGKGKPGLQRTLGSPVTGGFNGGGNSGYNGSSNYNNGGGSGGGATDIRINEDSLYSRVIVAAGDGGGGNSWSSSAATGGAAGGLNGFDGKSGGTVNATVCSNTWGSPGAGATQYSGGCSGKYGNYVGTSGTFGFGGNGYTGNANSAGGGGGGGWYGGGAGSQGNSAGSGAGGGGSGYVYTSVTSSYYPVGCLLDESNYLEDAETIAGNQPFTSPTGTSEIGHSGNGYARISYYGGDNSDYDSYTVKLKSDYGTIENSELTYLPGDTLGNIPQPILDNNNMEFVGWFTNKSFTKKVTSNTIVNASFTLYAKFIYTDEYCTLAVNSTQSFDYTGSEQTFTALCPGKYKLEVWGAQGGNSSYNTNSDIGGYVDIHLVKFL